MLLIDVLAGLVCISWVRLTYYTLSPSLLGYVLRELQTGLVTFCAAIPVTMHKNGGVHEWDMILAEVHEVVYVNPISGFNVTSVVYAPIILCTKLAIFVLYRRIFLPQRWGFFDWVLRIFMTIFILFYIATTIVKIWECTPRDKIRDKSVPGTCTDVSNLLDTSGLFNTITDILILLVPVKFA